MGLVNGLVTTLLKVPSFIVTLGTMLALLGLVSRVGTGTGFTIAQLSLAVNAGIGIWFFHVPRPRTSQARKVLTGILIAGIGSGAIAALR